MVRISGADRTQVLLRKGLRPFTPGEPIPDVQTTSRKWKPDPEVLSEDDDMYARARVSEVGNVIFDNDEDEPNPPNPREVEVESDHMNAETCSTLATTQESSPEFSFPHKTGYKTEGIHGA